MAFRGYFTLNGVEIANTSRVVTHIGANVPTMDVGVIGSTLGELLPLILGGRTSDCSLFPMSGAPLLGVPSLSSGPISPGSLLYTPPDGSRLYSPGLAVVGDCWNDDTVCFNCRDLVVYDDSWDGLQDYLADTLYRIELAPWYSLQVPESGEFGGIWVLDVKGLDTTPVQIDITENVGDGGTPGPPRNPTRKVTFDALLVACTSAGLAYGLEWLTCQLRAVNADGGGVLKYLSAHPGHSAVDPDTLLREAHGVVMTGAPTVQEAINPGRRQNQQAIVYKVEWELTITEPRIYLPQIPLVVEWDTVTIDPITWVHAADCGAQPLGCDPDPKLFAVGCDIEVIDAITAPPPSCGGCLPVCTVATHLFTVPSFDYPMRCREAAVGLTIRNTGDTTLNLQSYFRRCNVRDECDKGDRWPLKVSGLPPTAELVLDGISGRYWVNYFGRKRRPFGIVGTPTGAPWRPALMDRALCWEFVVLASGSSEFEIDMRLADREA